MLSRITKRLGKGLMPTPIKCLVAAAIGVSVWLWAFSGLAKPAGMIVRDEGSEPHAAGRSDALGLLTPSTETRSELSGSPDAVEPVNLAAPDLTRVLDQEPEPATERVFSGRVVDDQGSPLPEFSISVRYLGLPVGMRSIIEIPDLCESLPVRGAAPRSSVSEQRFFSIDGRYSRSVPGGMKSRSLGLVASVERLGIRMESAPIRLDQLPGGHDVELTVPRGATLIGRVSDVIGAPAGGSNVTLIYHGFHNEPRVLASLDESFVPWLHHPSWKEVKRTGENGSFRFGGLLAGSYELRAASEGFASRAYFCKLQVAEVSAPCELALVGAGSIAFLAATEGGKADMASGVYFRPQGGRAHDAAICPNGGPWPGAGNGSTGPIAEGAYSVWWPRGGGEGFNRTSIAVQAGFEARITLNATSGHTLDYVHEPGER